MWRIKSGLSQLGIFFRKVSVNRLGFKDSVAAGRTGAVRGIVRSKRYNQTEIAKEGTDENTVL